MNHMKRFFKYCLWTLGVLGALVAAFAWYVRSNDAAFEALGGDSIVIVAHAGGAIDGVEYTNSREAVERSLAAGCRYIELDLVPSAEGHLIAFHTNFDRPDTLYSSDPPTLAEFTGKKIWGRYTPLTIEDIDTLMRAHPEMILVVDKTDDPDLLDRYFASYRDRVMVECFSMERYIEVSKRGYRYALLNYQSFSLIATLKQDLKHLFNSDEPRVGAVVMNHKMYRDMLKDKINWLNRPVAAYVAHNAAEADSIAAAIPRCALIYSNEP